MTYFDRMALSRITVGVSDLLVLDENWAHLAYILKENDKKNYISTCLLSVQKISMS
jgi:hypothetical protein